MRGSNLTGKEWHAIKRAKKWAKIKRALVASQYILGALAIYALGYIALVGFLIIMGAKF